MEQHRTEPLRSGVSTLRRSDYPRSIIQYLQTCLAAPRRDAFRAARPNLLPPLVLTLLLGLSGVASGQGVTGEQVLRAIQAGRGFLLRCQTYDGSWPDFPGYGGGTTAMATLALLNSGVRLDDPSMKAALRVVRTISLKRTYVVSLKAQALAVADPKAYRAEIQAAADWLVKAQRTNGMWGYTLEGAQADFSNTQFALLGLNEAAIAGAKVPDSVWRKAEGAYRQSQRPDGGFVYVPQHNYATGSMTAAAVASLYITGNSLAVNVPEPDDDSSGPCCGRYVSYRPIARGLLWLARNFNAEYNPAGGETRPARGWWYYYYLYAVERVGVLSGLQYIGRHDWYREGAAQLVARQRADGSWREIGEVVDTAFALLFLAKGHRSVLVQKLKWANDFRWNTARNDLAHLVGFIGDRIGGRPVSWNIVEPSADVSELLVAPILYISGQEFPRFDADQTDRLRKYIDFGGTILIEATCSRSAAREGFMRFARATFPDHEPQRLPSDHPVFSAMFQLDGRAIELLGLEVGCRTSVFFSPTDLACQWENGDYKKANRTAFEIGANIAAYATASEPLRDRLAPRPTIHLTAATRPTSLPRGAVYLGIIKHGGDWQPFPRAIDNLARYLNRNLGVDVVPDFEAIAAHDPRLADHPIVYMTGARAFTLSEDAIAALRQHLLRGGTLLADACCGQRLFDASFRELAARLFPENPLERLPLDHPIFTGSPGFPLPEVTYLPALRNEQPDLKEPWLEGITLDGRTALIYSPFGLGCGLADSGCFACRGLAPEDARRLTANTILYALSH